MQTRVIGEICGTLLLRSYNSRVVIRLCGNVLVTLDPVDNQLAHFGAGAIDDRRIFVHREATTSLTVGVLPRPICSWAVSPLLYALLVRRQEIR